MFTTINIYDTILSKYYVHHILEICIYTGITATAKFVLCRTRQHLNLPVVTSSNIDNNYDDDDDSDQPQKVDSKQMKPL